MRKAIKLGARPAVTELVCIVRGKRSLEALSKSLSRFGVDECRAISAGGLAVSLSVRTKLLPGLLPGLCEHSDAVCIGRFYSELFSEHGQVIFKSVPPEILSSERIDG